MTFPADDRGYYIVWPDKSYYKKRLYEGDARYIGPSGHRAPLFVIPGNSTDLIIVEGELNALTLALVIKGPTIVSPGSVNEITRHINKYLPFNNLIAILDKDIPGVIGWLKLKDELQKYNKRAQCITVETDLNDVLQKEGKEGLQKWCEKHLAVYARVQNEI